MIGVQDRRPGRKLPLFGRQGVYFHQPRHCQIGFRILDEEVETGKALVGRIDGESPLAVGRQFAALSVERQDLDFRPGHRIARRVAHDGCHLRHGLDRDGRSGRLALLNVKGRVVLRSVVARRHHLLDDIFARRENSASLAVLRRDAEMARLAVGSRSQIKYRGRRDRPGAWSDL